MSPDLASNGGHQSCLAGVNYLLNLEKSVCRLHEGRIMLNPSSVLAAGAQLLSGGGADAWDLRCHNRFLLVSSSRGSVL